MDCPGCKYSETRVIESRPTTHDNIRRRRQCIKCGLRFTTDEQVRERKKKDVK
jgi:transcriptional repressor NrdR